MYRFVFELDDFESLPREAQKAILRLALEALVRADREHLEAHPDTPKLYASGVRYEREPLRRDNWQNIPRTLALRNGDCEDLVSWRVAELQAAGELTAHPDVLVYELPGEVDFHIVVRRADGSVEDPSRRLGMP
jgi:hypothetical protein